MPRPGTPSRRYLVAAGEVPRFTRMVMQLRPGQVRQRAWLRGQRAALGRWPAIRRWLLAGPDTDSAVSWPAGFSPLDERTWRCWPGAGFLPGGEICLLGVTRMLAPAGGNGLACWVNADWQMRDAPLLWRYHLYYWDWAWGLAASGQRGRLPEARALFAAMWSSWRTAVPPGSGPSWHPYPAALRAWSLCGVYAALVKGGAIDGRYVADLAAHAGFLRRNLETDVGGNHLIKNLKALTGLAVFFADEALLARTLRRLRRQLAWQVLPDGGHYERAPAYHCQVLGDLIDIAGLLRSAGRDEPAGLREAIDGMRGWLGAVLSPAGDVPLLNDGFQVSREQLEAVMPSAAPAAPLHVLRDTGLARAVAGGWHLLADIGPPCPRDLPAHAHADTLACVVHLDGEPLLIDTGTSTYQAGAVRDRERSTAAHNTVGVDGRDSTEVWGAFRAGRRARVRGVSASWCEGTVTIEASHDGYRCLPGRPRHHRRWSLCAQELRVDDTVTGRGRHRVVVRWHLAQGTRLRLVPGGAAVTTSSGEVGVTVSTASGAGPGLTAGTAEVAAGFGATVAVPVLAYTADCQLPARISTVWRRAEYRQEPR